MPASKRPTAAKQAIPAKVSAPELTTAQRIETKGIDAICSEIIDGQMMTDIARSCGVSNYALLSWIASDTIHSARIREARSQAAQVYEEKALSGILSAADPFELSKAKEAAHHYRWRASKISPVYADKVSVGGDPNAPAVRIAVEMSDEALLAIALQGQKQ